MLQASGKLLEIQDLKTYLYASSGVVRAVDGVSIEIGPKEAVGLVGESGCGKTMTALSIMRLVPSPPGKIVSGTILFKNRELLSLTEEEMRSIRGKEVSIVFQDPMTYLNPVMKVQDQIAEVISLHQGKADAKKKAIDALGMVGIPSPSKIADFFPHELSGGMRQRVLIAMALSSHPSLVILDEPTTALDVTVQAQILELIRGLKKDFDLSLLLITHDFGVVADICDRVYVMYAGKILECADPHSLYENPKSPYSLALVRSILSIDERKETFDSIGGSVPDLINPPSGCAFHPRCPKAKAICSEQEPTCIEVERGHTACCWLYA